MVSYRIATAIQWKIHLATLDSPALRHGAHLWDRRERLKKMYQLEHTEAVTVSYYVTQLVNRLIISRTVTYPRRWFAFSYDEPTSSFLAKKTNGIEAR